VALPNLYKLFTLYNCFSVELHPLFLAYKISTIKPPKLLVKHPQIQEFGSIVCYIHRIVLVNLYTILKKYFRSSPKERNRFRKTKNSGIQVLNLSATILKYELLIHSFVTKMIS